MCNHKKQPVWLTLLALLAINSLLAQTRVKTDSNMVLKSFVLQAGAGLGVYTSVVPMGSPALNGSVNRYSPVATIRLMWYPGYRLRFGFESGYTTFYAYKVKNGNVTGRMHLRAIPLLFIFAMQVVKRVNIYAGIGAYLETSHLEYQSLVESRALVLGSNIAISYTLPVTDQLALVSEAEWMNAYDTRDAALNLQLKLAWKFASWR